MVDGMLVMSDDRQTAAFLAQSAMDAELQQDAEGKFGESTEDGDRSVAKE